MDVTDRNKIILSAALIWLGAFLLYLPSVNFGFVEFDDSTILLNHPNLYNERSFIASLREILFDYFPREEPLILRDVTWALDSYIYGFGNPFGYHFGNVLLNACNVTLVFFWFLMLYNKFLPAVIIAVSFGVLPVHAEPVCWVMGRKDLLVAFFMLITLIAHTAFLQTKDNTAKKIYYLITVLTVTAALLSKINAITFFMVLWIYEIFFPSLTKNGSSVKFVNSVIRILPHLIMTVFIYSWYKNILTQWGIFNRGVDSLSYDHIRNLVMFTPLVAALYLKLIFYPSDYSVFYDFPSIHEPLTQFQSALSVCILLSLVLTALYLFRKRKDLFFFFTAFFLLMIPYFNIVYIGIWMANRYIYFSSVCILAGVIFITQHIEAYKPYAKPIFLIWIFWAGANSYFTYQYQQAWRSNHTLWTYENSRKEPSLMSYSGLANSFMQMAESDPDNREYFLRQAEDVLNKGTERFGSKTYPDVRSLYFLYSVLSGLKNESLEAQLTYCLKAYEFMPDDVRINRRMAVLYRRMASVAENDSEKEQLARSSLFYFEKFAKLVKNPMTKQKILSILTHEYEKFSFLEKELDRIKTVVFQ